MKLVIFTGSGEGSGDLHGREYPAGAGRCRRVGVMAQFGD